jgi:hypothetical protein
MEPAAFETRVDAVFLHYDAGFLVRRDRSEEGRTASEWLRFEHTPEDATLAVLDARRLFADIPYTRDPGFQPSGR